ncbi:hypothetical protein [Sphingomonas sp.]|uniref:hypothetical protein n=1 Tax=Sphingomonas sp. TaxID=28214 RepID=UPI003D6D3069
MRKQAGVSAKPTGAVDERRARAPQAVDGITERGIQLVSRWAGIVVFAAALAGIGYLIF